MISVAVLVLVLVYFVPTAIATGRRARVGPVLVINVLLGWTVAGWIVALVIAVWPDKKTQYVEVAYDGSYYSKGRVVIPGGKEESNAEQRSA